MHAVDADSPFIDLRPELLLIGGREDDLTRFDLEGRWITAQRGPFYYRRGMNGMVAIRPRAQRGETFHHEVGWLPPEESALLTARLHADAAQARQEWRRGELRELRSLERETIEALFDRIERWDPARYQEDVGAFHSIYGDIPILPPDQYLALYVQPARGCIYNRCRFCTLYRDVPFTIRSAEAWLEHLERIRAWFGAALSTRRGIFLGDANALDIDQGTLIARLETLRQVLPLAASRQAIFAFHDTFSGPRRTVDDYAALRTLGVQRLYIGLETGLDELRRRIAKPGRAQSVIERVRTVKAADISVGMMVLVGVGGMRHGAAHVEETVRVLRECGLDRRDVIFLSRLELGAGSDYGPMLAEVGMLEREEMIEEERAFRRGLPEGVPVGRYDVTGFVY